MERKSLLQLWFLARIFFVAGQYSIAQTVVNAPRFEPDPQAHYFADNFDPTNWRSQLELAYWVSDASGWETAADELKPAIRELSSLTASMDDRLKGGADSEFMAVLNSIKERGVVDESRTREFEVNWRLYQIDLIARTEGWAAAWKSTEQAILNLEKCILLDIPEGDLIRQCF